MLPQFASNANKFSDKDMAKRVIPKNLNTQARIELVAKGGKKFQEKADIFELCCEIKSIVELKAQDECKKREAQSDCQGNEINNDNGIQRMKVRRAVQIKCQARQGQGRLDNFPNTWQLQLKRES